MIRYLVQLNGTTILECVVYSEAYTEALDVKYYISDDDISIEELLT